MITRPIESAMPMTHLQVVFSKSLSARVAEQWTTIRLISLILSSLGSEEQHDALQNLNNQVFIFPPF